MAKKKKGSVQMVDDVLVTSVDLGTDVTGTLAVANGGTGQSTYTNGELLIGNTTGNTLAKGTITPGTGISVTNGGGSITIGLANGFGFEDTARLVSDTANSSNVTFTSLTDLALNIGQAGQTVRYYFKYMLPYYTAATTTGITVSLEDPSSCIGTIYWNAAIFGFAAAGSGSVFSGSSATVTGAITSTGVGTSGTSGTAVVSIEGILVTTGGLTGTLRPRFRSEVNTSSVTVRAEAVGMIVRMP